MSYKQFQNQFGSPKVHHNTSGGSTSQQNTSSLNFSRESIKNHVDVQQYNLIHKQNSVLREENQALRRQIRLMKKQGMLHNGSHSHQGSNQMNDLRETIKKQAGEIKELKMRLEVLSRQCKMYEQIIDKMQGKINKLTEHNKIIESKNQELQERKQKEKDPKREKIQLETLKQKSSEVLKKFGELQKQSQNNEVEWNLYKEQWGRQKTYYIHRIKDLEILMGIGADLSTEIQRRKH